jgi:putative transposase
LKQGRTDETSAVYGRADHWGVEGARSRGEDGGSGAQARRLGSDAYNWKAKYGGMDVSEAKRLKQFEDENAKLKKLLAEQMLDAAALRELLSKKW